MHRKTASLALTGLLAFTGTTAQAEPVGQWFSGYGQGITEYAIENDSAKSDYFYIACADAGDATIMFTVSKKEPQPGSSVVVTIADKDYELPVGEDKLFHTDSRSDSDTFGALWDAIRASSGSMEVRLATGETASFTLQGAAKEMPGEHCTTAYGK